MVAKGRRHSWKEWRIVILIPTSRRTRLALGDACKRNKLGWRAIDEGECCAKRKQAKGVMVVKNGDIKVLRVAA